MAARKKENTTEIYTLSLHDALPIYYARHLTESIITHQGGITPPF